MPRHKADKPVSDWRWQYRWMRNKWMWFTKPKIKRKVASIWASIKHAIGC